MEGVSLQAVTLADGSTAYIQHNSKGECTCVARCCASDSEPSPARLSVQSLKNAVLNTILGVLI
jgi:hypothetical protein